MMLYRFFKNIRYKTIDFEEKMIYTDFFKTCIKQLYLTLENPQRGGSGTSILAMSTLRKSGYRRVCESDNEVVFLLTATMVLLVLQAECCCAFLYFSQ